MIKEQTECGYIMLVLITTDDAKIIAETVAKYGKAGAARIDWAMPNTVAMRNLAVSLGLGEHCCVSDRYDLDDYEVVISNTPAKPAKKAAKKATPVAKVVEAESDDRD
tara:strand:+ start:1313 stop:1636 length:324 start_codon:yes stop_codon:yes gene_type:complete